MEDTKILFKNTTELSKETLQKFSGFIWLRYNRLRYWTLLIFLFFLLIYGINGAIHQIIQFKSIPNTFSILWILFSATIISVMIRMARGNIRIAEKAQNMTYHYEFTNGYIFITTELSSQKILYTDLSPIQNICNTEKYVYLMINQKSGYIIDKSGFENYNEKEFLEYLQRKFNYKYINLLDSTRKKLFTTKDIVLCIVLAIVSFILIFAFFDVRA